MLAKDQTAPAPKAVNIIRPSSPLLHHFKRPASPYHHLNPTAPVNDTSHSSSTASSSSPSTLSTLSSFSAPGGRATVLGPANFLSLYATQHKPNFGQAPISFPQRLLQRARSNSNLSKLTVISSNSLSEDEDEEEEEDELDQDIDDDSRSNKTNDDEDDEIDSIDGLSDDDDDDEEEGKSSNASPVSSDDEEEVSPSKIVARIKNGTIMNGRGEFVNKGSDDHSGWLDEARANRKIADLEIEKTSLLAVNTTLEATVKRQAARIAELEKRLGSNEAPLTPVSDKNLENEVPISEACPDALSEEEMENDEAFQRVKTMLQNLIDEAEAALTQKTKLSGKVLTDYHQMDEDLKEYASLFRDDKDEVTIRKLAVRRSWSPTHGNTAIMNRQNQRPIRRVSEGQALGRISEAQQARVLRPASFNQATLRPNSPSPRPPVINHTKTSMARTLSRSSSPAVMVSSPSPPPATSTSPTSAHMIRSASPRPSFSPTTSTMSQRSSSSQRPPSRASSLRRSLPEQQPPRWHY